MHNNIWNCNCEGVVRRDFLKVGALGYFGLSLPALLKNQAAQAGTNKEKSCILVWLGGGPSHTDMFDLKPEASSEYRGEFNPIETNVAGIRISEHLPTLAQHADKYALLRSVTSPEGSHERATQYLNTGYKPLPSMEYPSYGAIVAKEKGQAKGVPSYVTLLNPVDAHGPGYLGGEFAPFDGGDPSRPGYDVRDLKPPIGIPLDRVDRRRTILRDMDDAFRRLDKSSAKIASMETYFQQAYDMVYSPAAREAFDLGREPVAVRDAYGQTNVGQSALLARRLVEAGVRFVTITSGGWDTHQQNWARLKNNLLPPVDKGVGTLLSDLHQRGLLDTTMVIVMGEFGRTPKINTQRGGRDHWPHCRSILIAGCGIQGGQVVGASDDKGAYPAERPIRVEDLSATIMAKLDIDPTKEYHAPNGRPVKLGATGEVIKELG